MATLQTKAIQPSTGSNVNLGTSGDTVLLSSDSIQTNLYKDAGGNTLFQSDGAGTLSNVNSAMSGDGPKLIQSQTASGSASISFTTGIDSTYDQYVFYFVNVHPASNGTFLMFQSSTDGGSSYGVTLTSTAFSAYHAESGADGTLTYTSARDLAQSTSFQYLTSGIGTDNDQNAAGSMHLFAPSSTTYVKHWYSRANTYEAADYTQEYYMGGYFNTTSAINAIRFQMSSGNIDAGTFKMYGIT